MKRLILAIIFAAMLTTQGCWFIILPIGPIISAIRGPRYCVPPEHAQVGNRIRLVGGREGTITTIHGESAYDCPDPVYPICVEMDLDKPEGRAKK